jgi:hypothetical protein
VKDIQRFDRTGEYKKAPKQSIDPVMGDSACCFGEILYARRQHMNLDSLSIALREVTDCKRLLEALLTSSESFDYPKAKAALKQLQRKARELGKLQTELQREVKMSRPDIHVLDFSKADARAQV